MAELGPFRVVSRRRVGVGSGDDEGRVGLAVASDGGVGGQRDGRRILELLRFEGVSQRGGVMRGPLHFQQVGRSEVVKDYILVSVTMGLVSERPETRYPSR